MNKKYETLLEDMQDIEEQIDDMKSFIGDLQNDIILCIDEAIKQGGFDNKAKFEIEEAKLKVVNDLLGVCKDIITMMR